MSPWIGGEGIGAGGSAVSRTLSDRPSLVERSLPQVSFQVLALRMLPPKLLLGEKAGLVGVGGGLRLTM